MYQFVDRPVPSLDYASRFFIWAMRGWVSASSLGRCPCGTLGPVFLKWQMMDALPDFTMAMAHLNASATQQLVFGQPCCGQVHEIEAVLLTIHQQIWHGDTNTAKATAQQLFAPQSPSAFLIAMERYCHHLLSSPLAHFQLPTSASQSRPQK
ncbi:MAG: hypothetical protein V7676_10045 [Parasphingorhabdus sp.]|uniref:hypothetical protein n=1 Tax=Parasphingorhabdus sp. TaxID=2709688 RepID=UPI00300162DF